MKSAKIVVLFYLIFVLGILGVAALVNKTLNKKSQIEISLPPSNLQSDFYSYTL